MTVEKYTDDIAALSILWIYALQKVFNLVLPEEALWLALFWIFGKKVAKKVEERRFRCGKSV